jgi:hypothetical protein
MFTTPFVQMQQVSQFWAKAVEQQLTQLKSIHDQIAKYETQGVEQSTAAIDEAAKLWKETLSYGQQLSTDWRKSSLEAVEQTGKMFGG